MSAVPQLRALGGAVGVGAVLALTALHPYTRHLVAHGMTCSLPKGSWKALAILFALINLKNIPLVWHVCIQ